MLVLSRKNHETVVVKAADDMRELLRVTVLDASIGRVKLGFKANDDIAIYREEVWARVQSENGQQGQNAGAAF
jgi:carbon storage regulator CsrA